MNSDANGKNSKTLPIRKFAQFTNNFDQLEKQQKQIERIQKQQNHHHQYYNSTPNHEFINPFPYYKNFQSNSVVTKNNLNYVIQQHPSSQVHQRLYANVQNKHLKARNQFLMHKLESSIINNKNNLYNEPFTHISSNSSNINKKNSEFKHINTNNKRRSTQVYNL
jgi:hypothetical protein